MRHVLSLVLGVVLAPLIYVAALISAARLDASIGGFGGVALRDALLGLAAAVIAGGLYAVLVMARLSPVGPVVAGLLYLGATVWALLDAGAVSRLLRDAVPSVPDGGALIPGVTAFLAMPLLATIFSPRRWRRHANGGPGGYNAAPDYPPPPDSAAPAYQPTLPSISSYEPSYYTPPGSTTTAPTLDLPPYNR
jgi:hypothetical protein